VSVVASPSELVRYHHVIRLTQYRSRVGTLSRSEIDEFIAGWKELTSVPVLGLLYRELCRQVPEWSAMAAKEMDNPIDAVFLEYLIAEPGVDFDALSSVPPSQAHQ
jgi:hypothetical protein